MGYNDEHATRIVFDIETNPRSARVVFDIETCHLPDAADYMEPAEAPANYKDAAKIEAYVNEQSARDLERCGLDVDLCRVVAIGCQREGDPAPLAWTANDASEANMIGAFWDYTSEEHLVGFNCLVFDLPVLLRRSLYLGIQAPLIQIDRFKHPRVTDLADELSYSGKLKWRGLSFYCKRFGIPSTDTLTGADIALAVTEGRWDDIAAHVVSDVAKTAALASRMGRFNLTPELVL